MKNKTKFLIFSIFFSIFSVFLFSSVQSAVNNSQNNFTFNKQGDSGGAVYAALVPDYDNFQAWRATVGWSVEGHGSFGGSGGKYGIDMCLSPNGAMWNGPCWNIVDSNTGGNIGDGHGSNSGISYDIGTDSSYNLSYAVVGLYANDATFEGPTGSYPWGSYVRVDGRQVSIDSFNTSASTISTSQTVDVTWRTNETQDNPSAEIFSYSGPINCNIGASPVGNYGGTNRGTTCTPTGSGTAVFQLDVTGYNGRSGSRPKTITQTRSVDISAPAGSVIFSVRDGCSNGDIAGNATITLNGVGTQVTTSAGTYNTTTFTGVGNGTYTWSSTVPGYNPASGTVNVNNGAVVNISQPRTCGGGPVAPTCSSAGPDNDAFLVSAGTVRRYAYGVANATSVRFPTWSTTGGQNDIVWYNGTNAGGGTWFVDIPLASHSPANSTGDTMNVHVYLYNASFSGIWCDTANFTTTAPTTPKVTNVAISSNLVAANSVSQYTISVTATDNAGGGNIWQQFACINCQGENAGAYRGFITWGSTDWWPTSKNHMACGGGGWAAIQDQAPNNIYGHTFTNLVSCTTTVTGNTRIVNFVVTFDPSYQVSGPVIDNDISGYATNTFFNIDGWINFQTDFNIAVPPTLGSVTISPDPVINNNSTNHTITITGSSVTGGASITHQYGLINYDANLNGADGHTPADYRGFLTWYTDASYTGWDTFKNKMACAGGGIGAIQPGYGDTYLTLVSCSTSVSGNNRSVVFVVRFDPSFVTPITNNDISAYFCSPWPNCNGWLRYDTNFSLAPPTIGGVTISQPVINPDNTTQYDITVSASSGGGSPITHEYTLINYDLNSNGADGHTPAEYRGFLSWYTDSAYTGWDTEKNKRICTGGGIGAILQNAPNNIFGHSYLTLDSCSTSVSGVTRTTVFRVRFDPSFVSPTSNNDISGWACTTFPNCAAWRRSDTNFSLFSANGVPTTPVVGGPNTGITGTSVGPYTFVSTDPEGEQVRYGIDWSVPLDGTSDQTVPSSGYVNQNVTQSTNHTWGTAGAKTFTVRAEDTNGGFSAWSAPYSVTISDPPVDGVCGSRAGGPALTSRTYPTAATGWDVGDTYCSVGNPSASPAFPSTGNSVNWQCLGTNGGFSPLCTATHDNNFSVSVVVNTTAGGTVTSLPAGISCGGTCSTSFPINSLVTLVPTPNSAYWKFIGWGGDCSGSGACVLTVDGPKNVTATFSPRTFKYIEF